MLLQIYYAVSVCVALRNLKVSWALIAQLCLLSLGLRWCQVGLSGLVSVDLEGVHELRQLVEQLGVALKADVVCEVLAVSGSHRSLRGPVVAESARSSRAFSLRGHRSLSLRCPRSLSLRCPRGLSEPSRLSVGRIRPPWHFKFL